MEIHRHAEKALVAMNRKLPVPASVLLQRLRESDITEDVAIVVCRMTMSHGVRASGGTNGDVVVAIAREGRVITVMLRRSNQLFTPHVLRVDRVIEWEGASA